VYTQSTNGQTAGCVFVCKFICTYCYCIGIEQVEIDVVEIDEAIVSVATDWFNFTASDRLRVSVADGLEYIRHLERTGV